MKVIMRNKRTIRIWVLCAMTLLLYNCYESKDACIDSRATNYDVSGDINCCCEYPDLNLGFGFLYNEIGFRPNEKYAKGNDTFKILSIDILISEVALLNGTDSARVDTMITLPIIDGGSMAFIDDFEYLNLSSSSANIGRFMVIDTFNELNFLIGLNEKTKPDPQDISTVHPLYPGQSGWTESGSFPFMRMTMIRGTGLSDTLMLKIGGDVAPKMIKLDIVDDLITQRGDDVSINLSIDISSWLDGVDIIHATPNDLVNQLYTKLPDVIELSN